MGEFKNSLINLLISILNVGITYGLNLLLDESLMLLLVLV